MEIKADILPISKIVAIQRGSDGGARIVVEIPPGKHFIFEFPSDQAAELFQAAVVGLPPVGLLKDMSTEHPVFIVDDFAIGQDRAGDAALIVDFTGTGQVGMRITPELGRSLRTALDIWLADLAAKPPRAAN